MPSIQLTVNTDGACHGNPGPGGYAAWWTWNNERWEVLGGEINTTNNRMELGAVLAALRSIEQALHQGLMGEVGSVLIRSDSQYVIKGATEWMAGWKRKGWIGSDKKPIKNQDLWVALDKALSGFSKPWSMQWVRGHNGDFHNEHADALAQEAVQLLRSSSKPSLHHKRRVSQ
jgi:ribonuclease HI